MTMGFNFPTHNVAVRYVEKEEYIKYGDYYVWTGGYIAVIHPYKVSEGWPAFGTLQDQLQEVLSSLQDITYDKLNSDIPIFNGSTARCFPISPIPVMRRIEDLHQLYILENSQGR